MKQQPPPTPKNESRARRKKQPGAAPERKRGLVARYWRSLWGYAVTGLLVWIPLIITMWVTWLIVERLGFGIERAIRNLLARLNVVGAKAPFLDFLTKIRYAPGFGLLSALALFLATGLLMRYWAGRKLVSLGERLLNGIPLISRIYRAVQQIRDVFVNREGTVFQSVCLIEYPRPGVFVMAFITSTEQGLVQEAAQKELYALFVPTTPNPTSGFLLYVPPAEITELDISVEDAMKLIVSGGAFLPDSSSDSGGVKFDKMIQQSLHDPDDTLNSE